MSIPSWNKNRCLDLNFRYFAKLRGLLTVIPDIGNESHENFANSGVGGKQATTPEPMLFRLDVGRR